MQDTSAATFESKDQALNDGGGVSKASNEVRLWLAALEAADKEEKDWRKEAGDSVDVYRAEDSQKTETYFNILHSNVETTLPAVYNSTPVPDIRRRFNDPGDDSKTVADLLERAISYSLDAYDFDGTMRNTLFDAYVTGRGLARVRYVPYFTKADPQEPGETESPDAEAGEHKDGLVPAEPGETVAYEEVTCEYVPWRSFRRGPGRTWDDVSWIAFEHFLSREQLEDLNEKIGKTITLDAVVGGAKDDKDQDGSPKSEIFGRARVWEVWDKDSKSVLFIAPSHEAEPLLKAEDPLKLQGFWPVPRPIQPLGTPGNLVPMAPYRAYKNLANELNEITRRIQKLVGQLRVRGIYASSTPDMQAILNADDGELVPAQGFEAFLQGEGLAKAIAWWPIEPTVKALAQLYNQREQVKATIYEVTGLSDILRGNTQASETATAQQIKSQWGSLRIQRMQADVARFARDLFRIKAEIIASKFSMQNLMLMTGIELMPEAQQEQIKAQLQQAQQQAQAQAQAAQQQGGPPQPPQAAPAPPKEVLEALKKPSIEKVEKILRSDLLRAYKIDIESDSTIRADLTRDKQEISEFIQGTAAYVQAIGPATAEGTVPKPLAIKIFASFARLFRLGKSAEDALDQAEQMADAEAQNPPQQKPDPAMAKVQGELKLKQAQVAADQKGKEADLNLKAQAGQQDLQLAQQKMELEIRKMEMEFQLERERHDHEMQIKAMEAQQKQALAAESHTADMQMRSREHDAKVRQIEAGNMMAVDRHGVEMNSAAQSQDMAAEKHQAGIEAMKAKAQQQPTNGARK